MLASTTVLTEDLYSKNRNTEMQGALTDFYYDMESLTTISSEFL
jgi:hypothetical protein